MLLVCCNFMAKRALFLLLTCLLAATHANSYAITNDLWDNFVNSRQLEFSLILAAFELCSQCSACACQLPRQSRVFLALVYE